MGTLGIVALSVACGLVLAFLLLAVGLLAYLAFDIRSRAKALKVEAEAVQAWTRRFHEDQQTQFKSSIDSARASFEKIRSELKAQLAEETKRIAETLAVHQSAMRTAISKIDAESLQAASAQAIKSCRQIDKSIGALQKLILAGTEGIGGDFPPDEFAPENDEKIGTPPTSYSLSPTAQLDSEAEREETEAVVRE